MLFLSSVGMRHSRRDLFLESLFWCQRGGALETQQGWQEEAQPDERAQYLKVMMTEEQYMVAGRSDSHAQGLWFPNTTPGWLATGQTLQTSATHSILSKGRISVGPETGVGDKKVIWERWVKRERGKKLKNQACGGDSTLLRAATCYYALEGRRKWVQQRPGNEHTTHLFFTFGPGKAECSSWSLLVCLLTPQSVVKVLWSCSFSCDCPRLPESYVSWTVNFQNAGIKSM